MELLECAAYLRAHDNYLLVTHQRPDGDTLGSASALCHALRRLGKTAYLYKNGEITESFVPFVSPYFAPEEFVPEICVSVDVAEERGQNIGVHFVGEFGSMPAQDATPLSLVLTELVTNAVEHGFEGRTEGTITISAGRGGNSLDVVVEDDGNGMDTESENGMAKASGSGLGTQIVQTFVTNDFGGTIRWEPNHPHGTRVVLKMKLRAAQ